MKIYISLILLLTAFSSFGQNKNCSDFKIGEFVYPNNPNKVSLREETTQKSYNDGKLEAIWKVKWLNECEYELICEKVFNETAPFQIGDKIAATILTTDSKCYTFSLIVYNSIYPEGYQIPSGTMCKK